MRAEWNQPWVTPAQRQKITGKFSWMFALLVAGATVLAVSFLDQPSSTDLSGLIEFLTGLILGAAMIVGAGILGLEVASYQQGLLDARGRQPPESRSPE